MTTVGYGSHARRDQPADLAGVRRVRYRMLAAASCPRLERSALRGRTWLRTFHRGLATVAATQRGQEAMNLLMAAA
jgi:hypothetical protein